MISYKQIGGGGKGGVSAASAVAYHDKAFVEQGLKSGVDNYYANELAKASWQGKAAEQLGMAKAAVARADFAGFLEGKLVNRETGEIHDLAKGSSKDRRAGYDFTVSAPKSVSVVGLVGHDQRVIDAHVRANERAMAWMEKHGAFVRVKDEQGQNVMKATGNLIYATVSHETSRSNEPQLHNHNVVIAATYDADNSKWRSLTNDVLLEIRAQADIIYKSELARNLKRLGYGLEYDNNGNFEISGISKSQLEAFSTRSKEIDALLTTWGIDPSKANYEERQKATLASRDRKEELPREQLYSDWHGMAQAAGLDLAALVNQAKEREAKERERPLGVDAGQAVDGAGGPSAGGAGANLGQSKKEQREALDAVSWAVEHLSEREQSFRRADIETAALTFSKDAIGIDRIEWAVDRLLKEGVLAHAPQEKGEVYITTAKAIQSELSMLESIQTGKASGHVVMRNDADFSAALAAFEARKTAEVGQTFKLSAEQVTAARNILMHGDSYQGIQGDAGTGKTAALEMVKEAAEAKGWVVSGIATSSNAAKELEASSGISSQTVASFLYDRENAIKLVKADIAQLRTEIAQGNAGNGWRETVPLNVSTDTHQYRTKRYTFDQVTGEVFSSPNSFKQRIGERLAAGAQRASDAARQNLQAADSLASSLRARTSLAVGELRGRLGGALTSYERVDTVEAVAARTAHYARQNGRDEALQRNLAEKLTALANLERTGNREGKQTLLVMDEASLTGAKDTASISRLADMIGARVVFQGDTKQHGSVAAGKAFVQAQKAGMHTSVLKETRRFDNATAQTRQAIMLKNQGYYGAALDVLDRTEVAAGKSLAEEVAKRYLANLQELKARGIESPKVGVVTLTNRDRKEINAEIHSELAKHGLVSDVGVTKRHLDDPKLTGAEQRVVSVLLRNGVDHLIFRKPYKEVGIKNGDVLRVTSFDTKTNKVEVVLENGTRKWINPHRYDYFSPAKLESRLYSVGDQIEARANIKDAVVVNGVDKHRVTNGTKGVVAGIDEAGVVVKWSDGVTTRLDNKQAQFVDHSYVHTSFKAQGATDHREIVAVSDTGAKIFNRQAADVAITRARDNTEIVTTDYFRMRKSADKKVAKTTAIEIGRSLDSGAGATASGPRLGAGKLNQSALDSAIDNMAVPKAPTAAPQVSQEQGKEKEITRQKGKSLGM